MSDNKIVKYFKENKLQTIFLLIFLVFLTIRHLNQSKDLDDNGYTVEGTIVECRKLNMNGACAVKVEFYTQAGEKRTSENTLYNNDNCSLGKKVKLRYSSKTDLTDVLEEEM